MMSYLRHLGRSWRRGLGHLDIELNRGPSAVNDFSAVTQGSALTVTAGGGVLANDGDADA